MTARANITDRGLRYRAQGAIPEHKKVCVFCGRRNAAQTGARPVLEVGHLNGNESDGAPDNLSWTCKSCNAFAFQTLSGYGIGRLTRQFNPSKSGGAKNLGEWLNAVSAITPRVDRGDRGLGESTMSVPDAVAMIRATSHSKRSDFSSQLRSRGAGVRGGRGRYNAAHRKNLFGFGKPKAERDFWVEGIGGFATKAQMRAAAQREANETGRRAEMRWKTGSTWHTGFVAPSRTAQKKLEPQKLATYKGYAIFKTPDGEYYSTVDTSSRFDSLKEARAHIDWYVKGRGNPSKFDRCVKDVKKRGGAGNAYAVCTAAGARKKRKGNPAQASADAYEDFHGRPPDETVEVKKRVHFHAHLAGAGELRKLKVKGIDGETHTITGFKGALLAFNEQRNQLFIEGGDQSINLADYGITEPHELETLGKVKTIDYFTRKDHLGSEGGEAVYTHGFRMTNENGKHVVVEIARYPDLIYRVRDEQLEFSGGSYIIRAEGIDK